VVRAKLAVLRRHCEALGRPFDAIERTAIGTIDIGKGGMSTRDAIEYCRRVHDAGIQHLIVSLPAIHELTPIELLKNEVIPVVTAW
jgi:hypothetical protein